MVIPGVVWGWGTEDGGGERNMMVRGRRWREETSSERFSAKECLYNHVHQVTGVPVLNPSSPSRSNLTTSEATSHLTTPYNVLY